MRMEHEARCLIEAMKSFDRAGKIDFFEKRVNAAKMELTETEGGIFRDGYILARLAENLEITGPLSSLVFDIVFHATRNGNIFSGRSTWHNIAQVARQQMLAEQFTAGFTDLQKAKR